ncbi:hypothetical protein [Phenylobacterium sp.]|uniref:hypothetical protein n=1 Tax=Phenylobacterium sp. TaxID=1871053 RepID=UPI0011FFC91D|nr:hypothetical protein [Phenylobacterium sp.]THD65099.1 MAG: hypothetical protein E8A49_00025 [Phenylobacterium sp.]
MRLPLMIAVRAFLVLAWEILASIPILQRKKRVKQRVMKPYVQLDSWPRKIALVLTPIGLGFFCLVYGFFFALTAPYLIVVFAAPIAILMLLSIWALPEQTHAPTKTMEFLLGALLMSLVLWPNYLALALPGLPWITAIRLAGVPMAMLFLVSLSISRTFRGEMKAVALTIPGFWMWFAVFVAIQLITIGIAKSPGAAIQKGVIQQVNWVIVAAIAAWVCRIPGRAERYIILIMFTAIPMLTLQLLELAVHHVLWAGYVPSFLKIDDAIGMNIFASQVRSATGLYRTKVTFTTALGMAEYISLLTPFAIHFALGRYRMPLRVFGFVMVPVIFLSVRLTDARLGVIAFLISVMLYMLFWGMMRFRRNRRDLLAATIVYAYPAVFSAAGLLVMAVKPVKELVFGGGAAAASNAARNTQIHMAIPKMLLYPLGHGGGGAGQAMGYGAGEFIAIDNYYLVFGLDYGMIGVITFIGIFLLIIAWSVRSALVAGNSRDRELSLMIPAACSMSAFLVIKLVYGQADYHSFLFMLVGMCVALIGRVRDEAQAFVDRTTAAPAKVLRSSERDDDEPEDAEPEDPYDTYWPPRPDRPRRLNPA